MTKSFLSTFSTSQHILKYIHHKAPLDLDLDNLSLEPSTPENNITRP